MPRPSPPPSTTEERALRSQGRRTRSRLLDATVAALAEKGYHAARVDDIVAQAGVSHGTFYLYFANKEAAFQALAAQCAEDMEALAADLGPVEPGVSGRRELRRWLGAFLDLYRRHGVVIRAWAEQHLDDRQLRKLGAASFGHITASFERRLVPAESAPALRAAALLALIERFAYLTAGRQLGWTDDAALDTLAVLVHRGFFGGR